MNLQRLRYLCRTVDHGFNVSRAAKSLHTSQPGVSKQIRLLEQELGLRILVRSGNRIVALTKPGDAVLALARRILLDIENLVAIGQEHAKEDEGDIVLATTHVQARYLLLPVIKRFKARFPKVRLSLRQGSPEQVVRLVSDRAADIGLCMEPPGSYRDVVMLPIGTSSRCVIVPPRHPLLKKKRLTLEDLAAFPIINLDASFTGGAVVIRAFEAKGLTPNIVLNATDADVMKAYVAEGLGIGTLPTSVFDAKRDRGIRAIAVDGLFDQVTTSIVLLRDSYLRRSLLQFIEMLSPAWAREAIERAMVAATRG